MMVYNIKSFQACSGDSISINDDNVLKITEGPQQKLWMQNGLGLVFTIRKQKNSITTLPLIFLHYHFLLMG
jgi:hypothetical protein